LSSGTIDKNITRYRSVLGRRVPLVGL